MSSRAALHLALLTGTLACNGPAAETGFGSSHPGPTAPTGSTTGSGGTSSSGGDESTSTSESSSPGTTEPARDLGSSPDFGPGPPKGCKGKIDFLFVISRVGQMKVAQKQLLSSFPGFIDTIETMFPEFDTHILVANPEGTWSGWGCEDTGCTNEAPYCGEEGKDYVCGATSYEQVTKCDEVLGAGLLFNAGPYATNVPCVLEGGNRYITREEPDVQAAFKCIASVGTYGYPPPTGDAIIAAVSQFQNLASCNKGFLRPDALLFITLIIDTVDKSKSYLSDWYNAIVTAKKGDPNAVIMLGIFPQYYKGDLPGCITDTDHDNRLRDLIEKFPYHAEGDICAPSYTPAFMAAAKLMDEACDNFVVPQ